MEVSILANFIVQFPLITELFQEDILNKRFEIGRKIYNSLVTITKNRYIELIKTKEYRKIKEDLAIVYNSTDKQLEKVKKELFKKLDKLYADYGLTEYSFHKDVKSLQNHFKNNIDSLTAQKIATNLWKSYSKLLFGDGKAIHYKRYDTLNSLEGKNNKSGIKYRDGFIDWLGLNIKVFIHNNIYETEALKNKICYVRIVRKYIKSKYKFYVQIVFEGIPKTKRNISTDNKVGLDIGTQTIAIVSQDKVLLVELADKVQNIEYNKRKLLRKLDRSRRSTNPSNFNEDGTIKKQGNKKVTWVKSKKYIKSRNKLKELYRKCADVRKYQHEILSNKILKLGTNIYVETMNFKGLQKKAKKTTINEKTGKINKKKRFGKSLANKAPAKLITIIDRKLKYVGKSINEINTSKIRASQYNHVTNECNKKDLKDRWNKDLGIQRDLYSAFLIMNVKDNLEEIDRENCFKTFDNFKDKHDKEIIRLKELKELKNNKKLISSFGI